MFAQLFSDTRDLSGQVCRWRKRSEGHNHGSIQPLLDGLLNELNSCAAALKDRIESLDLEFDVPQVAKSPECVQRISINFDRCDCLGKLDALFIGFTNYIRVSADSIVVLERLGDLSSSRLVNETLAAAEKGRWLADACKTSLNGGRRPEWQIEERFVEDEDARFFREA